jgi:hypothetical protein
VKFFRVLPIIAATIFATSIVLAHERSESYSHWYLNDAGLVTTVTIPLREVMLLYQVGDSSVPPGELFRSHLASNVNVYAADIQCEREYSNALQAPSGFVRIELRFSCASIAPGKIQYRALFEVAPGHVHYAKLFRDHAPVAEVLITDSNDTWDIAYSDEGSLRYSFAGFFAIGMQHISSGADHIAFLLGLLLIAGTLRRSVIAVTGFTLGHSISLAAAVLGYLHADSQLIEAFIGFTVALVAIEFFLKDRESVTTTALATLVLAWSVGLGAMLLDLISTRAMLAYLGFGVFAACYLFASRGLSRSRDARATALLFIVTTCFGLVHGFGFAGFLMETGVLGTSLMVPLLGFNLGVELGQLTIVALVLLAASLAGRHLPNFAPALLAAGLCGTGLFWFASRTLA